MQSELQDEVVVRHEVHIKPVAAERPDEVATKPAALVADRLYPQSVTPPGIAAGERFAALEVSPAEDPRRSFLASHPEEGSQGIRPRQHIPRIEEVHVRPPSALRSSIHRVIHAGVGLAEVDDREPTEPGQDFHGRGVSATVDDNDLGLVQSLVLRSQ